MDRRVRVWCAWSGPVLAVVAFVGVVLIAGFVPPPSPDDSAREIADQYHDDRNRIRVGMVVTMIGLALIVPWATALAVQTRRASGSRILTYIQLTGGVFGVLVDLMFTTFASAAAFRPDELDPGTTRLLNDLVWFWWLIPWPPFAVWSVAVGIAILADRRSTPLFPRWAGYMTFWAALLYTPGSLAIFFHDGPFGYNGVVVWYIPTVVFFIWIVVMSVLMIQSLRRETAEPEEPRVATEPTANVA